MAKLPITLSTVAVDNVSNLADQVKGQAATVKLAMDQYGIDDKNYTNGVLIAELNGNSGSYKIGHDSESIESDNVGDALEENRQAINDAVLGQIPDNSLTNNKLGADIKVGSLASLDTVDKSTLVNAINEVNAKPTGSGIFEYYTPDVFATNQKFIEDGQDSSVWTQNVGVITDDTSNFLLGNQAIRLTAGTSGINRMDKNGINLDLTKLEDGSASTDDDFIVAKAFISNISTLYYLALSFDQATTWTGTDVVQFTIHAEDLVEGWNTIKIKKSDLVYAGAGALTGIQSIRFTYRVTVASPGDYAVLQYIQLVKADPDDTGKPSYFQKDGVNILDVVSGDYFVGLVNNEHVIREFKDSDANGFVSLNTGVVLTDEMIVFLEKKTTSNADVRSITYWVESDFDNPDYLNNIRLWVSEDKLQLKVREAGVTTDYEADMPVNAGDIVTLKLKKIGSTFYGTGSVNGGKEVHVTGTSTLTGGVIAYGSLSTANDDILNMGYTTIKHSDTANRAFVADRLSIRYNNGAFVASELDFGELGIDTANNRLYVKVNSTTVKYTALT